MFKWGFYVCLFSFLEFTGLMVDGSNNSGHIFKPQAVSFEMSAVFCVHTCRAIWHLNHMESNSQEAYAALTLLKSSEFFVWIWWVCFI